MCAWTSISAPRFFALLSGGLLPTSLVSGRRQWPPSGRRVPRLLSSTRPLGSPGCFCQPGLTLELRRAHCVAPFPKPAADWRPTPRKNDERPTDAEPGFCGCGEGGRPCWAGAPQRPWGTRVRNRTFCRSQAIACKSQRNGSSLKARVAAKARLLRRASHIWRLPPPATKPLPHISAPQRFQRQGGIGRELDRAVLIEDDRKRASLKKGSLIRALFGAPTLPIACCQSAARLRR